MRANRLGDLIAGVTDLQITYWGIGDASPRALGRGAAAGWLNDDQIVGAGPSMVTATRLMNWELMPFDPYAPNDMAAGGHQWIASRATEDTLTGTVPAGYDAWKAHDVGPTGTILLVLNGVYKAIWPSGAVTNHIGAQQARATNAGIVCVDGDEMIRIYQEDLQNGVIVPQQLPGGKAWVTTIGRDWLLYHCFTHGLVCHHKDDASRGYQIPGTYFQSPCGVTLSDGRTLIAWSDKAGEQVGDLRRTFVELGVGMLPFAPLVEPPIPVPASIRNGWFGLTDAAPLACGNTTVGWYDDDPRPCVESAPWIDDAKARSAKCLGIIWSPIEAPDERDEAVRLALVAQKPILVYCDAPVYKMGVLQALDTVRRMGADAVPFVQAYPVNGQDADQALARIRDEIERLIARGEDRIAIWRYARYGAFPEAVVDALLVKLTELREQTRQIVYDAGFRKITNLNQRIFDYYTRSLSAMMPGQPPPLYRPPVTIPPIDPPIEPPITPPTPEEPDTMPPTDPLKPGKTREAYSSELAHVISDDGPNKLMSYEDAYQGIWQTWDQHNLAKDFQNGNSCVRGACSRGGTQSVIVDPLLWDRVSPIVRAIDLEFLRRG